MPELSSEIFTAVKWISIIVFSYFLFYAYSIKKLVFKTPKLVVIPRESIPEYILPCFETASPLLEDLGFTYRRNFYYPPMTNMRNAINNYVMEFINYEYGTMASVVARLHYSTKYTIEFVNLFEDGDIWSTINGIKHFLLPGYIPGITHFDDYLPDDSAAWKAHTQRILNSGKTIVKNEEEIENKNDSFDGQMLKVRVLQGMFYPLKTDNFFRLTWKGAFCAIFKIYLGRIKERRLNRRIVKTSLPKEAVLESLESKKEFEQAINSESKSKISAPIVSAILFIVISAYFFDVLFTLALFAVLALHEAGHWITMKWLGHNNVAVYFIPLLGAVTIGESKKIISPMMQLLTYLAGPLPGILLAFAIIKILPASAPYTFLNMFFSILLYVNCFNLLPLFPLDGGRIVDTFLLSRMPRLRFCFALLSTIVLCIITLSYTFFSIACVFISILLFIFLPTQRHLLRLRLAIGRVDAVSESEAKEIILNALESPKFEKWSDSKRNTMLDIMVSELINTKMNLIQVFITAVIYGLSLYLSYVLEIFAVL